MENIENNPVQKNLQLDTAGIGHLNETRQWTNFISIVGFVFIGIMSVIAFAIPGLTGIWDSTPMGGPESIVFTIVMILMVVLYFFPIYYLYTFSRYSKLAILNNDNVAFNEAMRYLKKHYRFMGILVIVLLSFYILIIIIGFMAGSLINVFERV